MVNTLQCLHPFVITMCGYHPPVVCTLPWLPLVWFPPCHGLHILWFACVVSTLPWFAPCHGYHTFVISTFPWFAPCCGFHTFVISTLPWFAPCRGYQTFMVSTLQRELKTHLTSMASEKEVIPPASF